MPSIRMRKAFTLVELLVVIAIIAILAVVLVLLLNPVQILKQGRDGNRISSLSTLDKAISLYYSNALNNPSTLFMGTSSLIYVSIPDPAATTTAGTNCASLGLPSIGMTYHCAASSTYLKIDGTGWIPINFTGYPGGPPISALPKDPVNTTSSGEYLVYITDGVNYELMGNPEATKDQMSTTTFIKGTSITLLANFP